MSIQLPRNLSSRTTRAFDLVGLHLHLTVTGMSGPPGDRAIELRYILA